MALVFCVDGNSNGRRNRGKLLACLGCSDSKFFHRDGFSYLSCSRVETGNYYILVSSPLFKECKVR